MDIGKDTAASDRDAREELVELLVVLDREGDVTGDDTGLLVVPGRIPRQFEDFGAQILQHGGEVDGRTGTHPRRELALPQVPADTSYGELETRLRRRRGRGYSEEEGTAMGNGR